MIGHILHHESLLKLKIEGYVDMAHGHRNYGDLKELSFDREVWRAITN